MKLTVVKKKFTFEDYYIKKYNAIVSCAKRDKISVDEFLLKNHKKTVEEYRQWQLSFYTAKDCHSFWHRECTNKGIECHHCCHYYSTAEWDKMSTRKRNEIKNS
jgi:hypothetical protein